MYEVFILEYFEKYLKVSPKYNIILKYLIQQDS